MDGIAERGTRVETRQSRIAEHLAKIDPVLIPFAEKLSQPPFKDLSNAESFKDGMQELEPKDLVLVHLTDTFPQDGIIHPAVHYNPTFLRFTTHFTVNAASEPVPLWGFQWDQKKYAILIPLDKVKDRILALHPNDTYLLDDLPLPEGSIIIKDKNDVVSAHPGKARIVEADYSEPGERLTGFQVSVYKQMIDSGYFPMRSSSGGGSGWNAYGWRNDTIRIFRDFCKKNGMEYSAGLHANHWTGVLETLSESMALAIEDNDHQKFRQTVVDAKETILEGDESWFEEKVPQRYKDALVELIKDYQQIFGEEGLPDLPPLEAEEKARAKIVDLSQDRDHLLHTTKIQFLPLILEEGMLSTRFAGDVLGHPLHNQYQPRAQRDLEEQGFPGKDYISVNDPQTVNKTTLRFLNWHRERHMFFNGPLQLLISGEMRGRISSTRSRIEGVGERLVKRRVPPRFFDGLIVRRSLLKQPAGEIARYLFKEHIPRKDSPRRVYSHGLRMSFLSRQFGDIELDTLRNQYLEVNKNLQETYLEFLEKIHNEENGEIDSDSFNLVPHFLLPTDFTITDRKGRTTTEYDDTPDDIALTEKDVNRKIEAVSENPPKNISSGQYIEFLKSILAARRERLRLENLVMQRYVEKTAGKLIDKATIGDFVVGLCKKKGIPLYDMETGAAIWAK